MVCNGTYQYHNCIYNSLPEEEPSSSKLVEKTTIKNYNINLQYVQFVGSYFIIILKCTVQKWKKNKKNYYYYYYY
jgi:hypothetical protein